MFDFSKCYILVAIQLLIKETALMPPIVLAEKCQNRQRISYRNKTFVFMNARSYKNLVMYLTLEHFCVPKNQTFSYFLQFLIRWSVIKVCEAKTAHRNLFSEGFSLLSVTSIDEISSFFIICQCFFTLLRKTFFYTFHEQRWNLNFYC